MAIAHAEGCASAAGGDRWHDEDVDGFLNAVRAKRTDLCAVNASFDEP